MVRAKIVVLPAARVNVKSPRSQYKPFFSTARREVFSFFHHTDFNLKLFFAIFIWRFSFNFSSRYLLERGLKLFSAFQNKFPPL